MIYSKYSISLIPNYKYAFKQFSKYLLYPVYLDLCSYSLKLIFIRLIFIKVNSINVNSKKVNSIMLITILNVIFIKVNNFKLISILIVIFIKVNNVKLLYIPLLYSFNLSILVDFLLKIFQLSREFHECNAAIDVSIIL